MKKTLMTIFLSAAAIGALNAQTVGDALTLSENNYEGTARTIALGGAVTALGSDLGSITMNPAGSAVAGYSQITISPGFSFCSTMAQGVTPAENGWQPSNNFFQSKMQSSRTRFMIPNLGFTFNIDTGRKSGLKGVTFGFVMNGTNTWNEDVYAKGTNDRTTFLGAMASGADGFTPDQLMSDDAFNNVPWSAAIGYYTGMISHIGDNRYIGATEMLVGGSISMPGTINQQFGMTKTGGKYDYLFNVGFNISDFIYLGANIGITSASYTYSQYMKESAVNFEDFEIKMVDSEGKELVSYFNEMTYKSAYTLNSTGVYGKFGLLVTPVKGLRLGAAIQTPTYNAIKDTFKESGQAQFKGPDGGNYNESSPDGESSYALTSPFRANFGAAYTFGRLGFISADYEVCNYGSMQYKNGLYTDREELQAINDEIRTIYGPSHSVRLGAEIKPFSALALRAGYGLTTAPEKKSVFGNDIPRVMNQHVSFGIGFSSKGSFFMDLAARYEFVNALHVNTYNDYIFSEDASGEVYVDVNDMAPVLHVKRNPWKAVMTLGWRF